MSTNPQIEENLREKIIAAPETILEDQDVMRALMTANERALGGNIVDLRGIAMERLEARLDRLEDTHRSVIAAAYENLAGTNQVHRAILRMLDPVDFEVFLTGLGGEVAEILRVDSIKLVLESMETKPNAAVQKFEGVLSVVEPGFVDSYLTGGRNTPVRQVTMRQVPAEVARIYGEDTDDIRSEACLKLDFGPGCLPGMLVLGAIDPQQFTSQQGSDLLAFFSGVFERSMRRWLA